MKQKLFDAAQAGNISQFRTALSKATIDEVNEHEETPLMVACKAGHLELLKFMLSRGADTTAADRNGLSIHNLASSSTNPEIVKLFNDPKITKLSESKVLGKQLVTLAENLDSTFTEFTQLFEQLDEKTKLIFMLDLRSITHLLRNHTKLSLFDGFSFALTVLYLKSKVEFDEVLSKLKTDTAEDVVKLAGSLLNSTTESDQPVSENNFVLNLPPLLDVDDTNKARSFYYQYSEILAKADGVVSEQEAKILRYLSKKFFQGKEDKAHSNQQPAASTTLESILSGLNNLVGMENIKNDIKSLVNVIKVNQLRKKEGLPDQKLNMHSVFIGPPGTGKTTIARMMADIYFSLNVLDENNFVEVDRSSLVAGYVGQTAIKTDEVINKALNGVLFIDEAYTLARKNSEGDFGQEAIDILLKRMEDSRDKLIVIVAGYEEEMNIFINSNPGLASRFNRFFYFSDYAPSQLMAIYKKSTDAAGFVLSEDAIKKTGALFEILYTQRDGRFGNARLVRNVFEKTFEKHANRTASIAPISRAILTTIQVEDVPYDDFVK